MKKSILFIYSLLYCSSIIAQIGIGTTSPNATLDVQGKASTPTSLDGIIPPRLTGDQLSDKTYTSNQIGAVVYITAPDSTPSGQTINVNSSGFYFFDGSEWISIAAGGVDKTEDAFVNNAANSRIELETQSDGSSARAAGTEFVIQDDGNVGIGIDTPSETLELMGSLFSQTQLTSGNYTGIYSGLNALGGGFEASVIYNSSAPTAGVGTNLTFVAVQDDEAVLGYTEDVTTSTSNFISTNVNVSENAAQLYTRDEGTDIQASLNITPTGEVRLDSSFDENSNFNRTEINWNSPTAPIRFSFADVGVSSYYEFPRTDGILNQVLRTDGSGTLSWRNTFWIDNGSNPRIEVGFLSDGVTPRPSGDEFVVADNGNLGIGETNPLSKLHIQTANAYDQLKLENSYTPTSSSDPNGTVGDVAWDDDYIYIRTNSGWKRSALSTW